MLPQRFAALLVSAPLFAFGHLSAQGTVAADVPASEMAECAQIDGELSRLNCYDQLAAEHGLTATSEVLAASGSGSWVVDIETNPIDDSRTVNAVLRAESGESRFGEPIFLVVRCMSGDTQAYIVWNDYLGDEARVTTRMGSEEARTSRWSKSTNSQATFFPGNVVETILAMTEVDTFVAQVTPYNENPVTAVFNLEGISEAISDLRATCGW